ncbi:MAG: hypothetical protein Q9227_003491 [Pyrenula ochraceoflavens]
MNFAPYQDQSPEIERALSPPPQEGRRSKSPRVRSPSPTHRPFSPPLPNPSSFASSEQSSTHQNGGYQSGASPVDLEGAKFHMEAFQTSLPMRMDIEAMLAYLVLPPAGGVFLLLFEHKSDYVRFHAWQSSMLFTAVFVVHMIFAWSSILSWLLFAGDVVLISFLAFHAYRDVETLDHFEIPFFGRLANSFVDDE